MDEFVAIGRAAGNVFYLLAHRSRVDPLRVAGNAGRATADGWFQTTEVGHVGPVVVVRIIPGFLAEGTSERTAEGETER